MNLRSVVALTLLCGLTSCASIVSKPGGHDGAKLLGTWELERFDNIPRTEVPPGRLSKLVVGFRPDGTHNVLEPPPPPEDAQAGTLRLQTVDRFRQAREREYGSQWGPYSLDGTTFHGWFGLTNDIRGAKRLLFSAPDEFRITYGDGSHAYFKRIAADADNVTMPATTCAPYTVRGKTFDEAQINAIRAEFRRAATNPALAQALIGQWLEQTPQSKSSYLYFSFEDGNVVRLSASKSAERHEPWAKETIGTYAVRGAFLTTTPLCDELLKIALTKDRLSITLYGDTVSLRRLSGESEGNQ